MQLFLNSCPVAFGSFVLRQWLDFFMAGLGIQPLGQQQRLRVVE